MCEIHARRILFILKKLHDFSHKVEKCYFGESAILTILNKLHVLIFKSHEIIIKRVFF